MFLDEELENECVEIAALQRDALFEMLKYLKTNKLM